MLLPSSGYGPPETQKGYCNSEEPATLRVYLDPKRAYPFLRTYINYPFLRTYVNYPFLRTYVKNSHNKEPYNGRFFRVQVGFRELVDSRPVVKYQVAHPRSIRFETSCKTEFGALFFGQKQTPTCEHDLPKGPGLVLGLRVSCLGYVSKLLTPKLNLLVL